MIKLKRNQKDIINFIFIALLAIVSLAFYINHIIVCISKGAYMLLVAGCILPPVGVIHGFMSLVGIVS